MIKKANREDSFVIAKMAINMWGDHTIEELTQEFDRIVNGKEAAVFLIYDQNAPVGFAQC